MSVEGVRAPVWKRVMDLMLALPVLAVLAPILTAIWVLVVLDTPGPGLYRSERVGLGGRTFKALKLRTMIVGAAERGTGVVASVRDDRITRVGAKLRRWSLDELPQLINVVLGDMSIVGPRPTVPEQVGRYTERDRRRLRVRPGLTGLAQVSGRNDLAWSERIELDLMYIDRMNPLLDLAIILRTPWVVLTGRGLYGRAGVTPDYVPNAQRDEDR